LIFEWVRGGKKEWCYGKEKLVVGFAVHPRGSMIGVAKSEWSIGLLD